MGDLLHEQQLVFHTFLLRPALQSRLCTIAFESKQFLFHKYLSIRINGSFKMDDFCNSFSQKKCFSQISAQNIIFETQWHPLKKNKNKKNKTWNKIKYNKFLYQKILDDQRTQLIPVLGDSWLSRVWHKTGGEALILELWGVWSTSLWLLLLVL